MVFHSGVLLLQQVDNVACRAAETATRLCGVLASLPPSSARRCLSGGKEAALWSLGVLSHSSPRLSHLLGPASASAANETKIESAEHLFPTGSFTAIDLFLFFLFGVCVVCFLLPAPSKVVSSHSATKTAMTKRWRNINDFFPLLVAAVLRCRFAL